MSATVLREKRQTTLPADVVDAAGIRVNDQIDWRYEGGEIRGRKLEPKFRRMSYEECKRAIANTKIKLTADWEQVKKDTR